MLNENLNEIAPEQYKKFVAKALDKAYDYVAQLDLIPWLTRGSNKKLRVEDVGAGTGAKLHLIHDKPQSN